MCVCAYTKLRVGMHVYVCAYTCARTYVCACMCVYVHTRVHIRVCACVGVCIPYMLFSIPAVSLNLEAYYFFPSW